MFHNDGTPKVAATAIHDLTTILADNAPRRPSFATAPLSYSVSGMPSSSYQFAMEKSDGTYDVALWWEPLIWNTTTNAEVPFASKSVTVTFGKVYQTINLYDPLAGTGSDRHLSQHLQHRRRPQHRAVGDGADYRHGRPARSVYQHRHDGRCVREPRPRYDRGGQRRRHRQLLRLSDNHRLQRQPGCQPDRQSCIHYRRHGHARRDRQCRATRSPAARARPT